MKEQQSTYLEDLGDGVLLIRLGAPEERVVTLTVSRLSSLRNHLIDLEQKRPAALIIAGPHADMFTAGVDLNIIKEIKDPAEGERFAREGQKVFDILERLPFPTIAAISGPCVGGGCELVLACRYRLASDQKNTLVGLPEVKLGIIPGFGGTQRLPRLIGISKGLDIICAGKTLNAQKALAAGLVDKIYPYGDLIAKAKEFGLGRLQIDRPVWPLKEKLLTKTALGRKIVSSQLLPKLSKGVAKFYPAPARAVDAVLRGLSEGVVAGLDFEAKEIGSLITSEQSKNLVSVFFASEAAKGLGKAAKGQVENLGIMVIGAGTMGAGIAQVFAASGCKVALRDTNLILVEKGIQTIKSNLDRDKRFSTTEKEAILKRVNISTPDSNNLDFAIDIVVEAIFEDMEVKKQVLSQVAREIDPNAIIASNTSSLSISEIASVLPNPSRVVGMHFFNPAPKMPLIEIVRGKQTSDKVVVLLSALTSKLGKTPVVVEDVPGFLVNRILFPYLAESLKLLAEGFSITDIDSTALDYGMPMGPLRLLDEIGLDVAEHVSKVMVAGYGERMRGPDYLATLVSLGRKGKKNAAGFFDFANGEAKPWSGLSQALALPASKSSSKVELERRLFGAMQAEAKLCYQEGVAGRVGPEALAQINLASIMGIGFPAFRGGVLQSQVNLRPS
jgi:3-hydroxyacyl-CoA dehydrogenase/enoyl-CoA hydratase/3-hydroxybutyryl-CoA epimerase